MKHKWGSIKLIFEHGKQNSVYKDAEVKKAWSVYTTYSEFGTKEHTAY